MISPAVNAVMCDRTGNFLLVYVVNTRERREKYGYVDLRKRQFAWVFIPNELYRRRFFRVGEVEFENTAPFALQQADTEPYIVNAASLHLSDFVRQDGADIMTVSD